MKRIIGGACGMLRTKVWEISESSFLYFILKLQPIFGWFIQFFDSFSRLNWSSSLINRLIIEWTRLESRYCYSAICKRSVVTFFILGYCSINLARKQNCKKIRFNVVSTIWKGFLSFQNFIKNLRNLHSWCVNLNTVCVPVDIRIFVFITLGTTDVLQQGQQ